MTQHTTERGAPQLARWRLERWIRATVDGVVGDLASTHGGRNAAARDAGIRLGGLVRYGLVTEADAIERLLGACEGNGYARKDGQRTALGVIRRGMRYGAQHGELPQEIADLLRAATVGPHVGSELRPRPDPRPRSEPARRIGPPPAETVEALWRSAISVLDDAGALAWLERRGIDAVRVHDGDLARALPPDAQLPRWAWGPSGPWIQTGHRLIVPLLDAHGRRRSVLARDVTGARAPKSLAPGGYTRRGLVMADGGGRAVLADARAPRWWPAHVPLRVWIAEGEPDYLSAAAGWSDADEAAPVVLGIVAGSWSAALAARVPDDAEVTIATDPDPAGDVYAATIAGSLRGRPVRLQRWSPR